MNKLRDIFIKVIAGVDGSKYVRWATEWIAQFPFTSSPQVTALHVVDTVSLRAPFILQLVVIGNEPFIRAEITRLVTRGKKIAAEIGTRSPFASVKRDCDRAAQRNPAQHPRSRLR